MAHHDFMLVHLLAFLDAHLEFVNHLVQSVNRTKSFVPLSLGCFPGHTVLFTLTEEATQFTASRVGQHQSVVPRFDLFGKLLDQLVPVRAVRGLDG